MTRSIWAKGALALVLALGVGGLSPAAAQDDFDEADMDYEEAPAASSTPMAIHGLDIQLSAHDDEDFPGAFLVTFQVTGGDLGMATGFVVEDTKDSVPVFQDGYLDPSEDDEGVLVGMAAWSVGAGDCGITRNRKVVVVSEEYTEEGEIMVTRLGDATGTIVVPAAYCTQVGIGTD